MIGYGFWQPAAAAACRPSDRVVPTGKLLPKQEAGLSEEDCLLESDSDASGNEPYHRRIDTVGLLFPDQAEKLAMVNARLRMIFCMVSSRVFMRTEESSRHW